MTYTVTCEKCDKKFTKPTQNKAEQARRMHMIMVHTKGRWKNRRPAGPGHRLKDPVLPKTKRSWTRRPKAASATVCFCPRCGLNLVNVAIGMLA